MNYSSPLPWDARFSSRSPLFAPLAAAAAELQHCAHWPAIHELNNLLLRRRLLTGGGAPLAFVAADRISPEASPGYEPRAYLSGELETRVGNWHDLFNALVWLSFPKAKAAINARHHHALQLASVTQRRSTDRDALTLFDESGVIVACDDPALLALVENFAWKELFWRRREEVLARMRFYVFGHGLYEKALRPFIGLTGKAVLLPVDGVFLGASLPAQMAILDDRLATLIAQGLRHTHELHPLPVLGIPGCSEDNAREAYYDNRDYFRPGRRKSANALPS